MGFQISPGISVKEIDLTTIVPQVSTTEGGIAAHLSWGPVSKRILVSSEDVLVNQFQVPGANTYPDFFTAANFLAYGNQLHVVRVIRECNAAVVTTDVSTGRNATTNSANGLNTLVKNSDQYELSYSSGTTCSQLNSSARAKSLPATFAHAFSSSAIASLCARAA